MQTEMPFYETPEEALSAAVQHLGGAKKVGAMLWPDKTADTARSRLLDCLNTAQPAKLDLSEAMFIFKKAKEAGCHSPFIWFCGDIGYESRPTSKAEETDRLTAVIDNATRTLAAALPMLERMQRARVAA